MDLATFRTDFPEFADSATYPDATVTFYLTLAQKMLTTPNWDSQVIDYGQALFIAHHLAIATKDGQASSAGAVPGKVEGVQSSKSVDRVSISYDTNAVTLTDAGFWNMTSYGIRFYQLARMVGAGMVQM